MDAPRRTARVCALATATLLASGQSVAQVSSEPGGACACPPGGIEHEAVLAEVSAFYRDLHAQQWPAVLDHFWPAKITARWQPPVGNSGWEDSPPGAATHHSTCACSIYDANGAPVSAEIHVVAAWARVVVSPCGTRPAGATQTQELRLLSLRGRWKIVSMAGAATKAAPDACALLSKADVAAAQGEEIVAVKAGERPGSGVVHRQCFYTAATFEKSVSLEVTVSDSARATDTHARARWRQIFHGRQRGKETHSRKEESPAHPEDEEAGGPPRRLSGIGDEAFWISDPRAGALYVLKRDTYFRLSLGGWADQKVRLQKTKTLARKVAKRL